MFCTMLKTYSSLFYVIVRSLLLVIVFIISVVVANLYTTGDQYYYTKVYNNIGDMRFYDALDYYRYTLSSIEFVHFLAVWLFSSYISKIYLFSILNTIFAGLIIKLFDNIKVNIIVTAAFVLSNYYVYVLYFASERLKIGVFLFVLALCFRRSVKHRASILFLSCAAHFQMILVVGPKVVVTLMDDLIFLIKTRRLRIWLLLSLVPLSFLPVAFFDYIYIKFTAYNSERDYEDYFKVISFMLLSLFYFPKSIHKYHFFIYLFSFIVMVFLIGDSRVNMIVYIYFLYFSLNFNHGMNLGVLITSIYFFGKTILFLTKVSEVGNGFN